MSRFNACRPTPIDRVPPSILSTSQWRSTGPFRLGEGTCKSTYDTKQSMPDLLVLCKILEGLRMHFFQHVPSPVFVASALTCLDVVHQRNNCVLFGQPGYLQSEFYDRSLRPRLFNRSCKGHWKRCRQVWRYS